MMRRLTCFVFALAAIGSPAAAADPTKGPSTIAAAEREASRNLPVQVALKQNGIVTGYVALQHIDALLRGERKISSGIDGTAEMLAMAAREAEVNLAPLQRALAGFDSDTLALEAVQAGLARSGWLRPSRVEIARQPSLGGRNAFLASGPGKKAILIDVEYYVIPEGSRIEAVANIAFAKPGPTAPAFVSYHRVTSIVQLAQPSFDPMTNIRRWSANQASPAKAGLAAAFSRLGDLVGQAVDMTPAEVAQLTAKDVNKTYLAGRYGPPVQSTTAKAGVATIWARGLVSASSVSDGQ